MTTAHSTHTRFQPGCVVCRWERLAPEEQEARRAARREQATVAWRRRHPERAARRDAILADRSPEPCHTCGAIEEVHAFVTDYDAGTIKWLCRACARASRPTFERAARRAA